MNKCGSTALNYLGNPVETGGSKSKDVATSSVVQKNDTKSCQHFSLRGYAADMRFKNPKACNPFDHSENGRIKWEQLQVPLDVPRFRWWLCENCARQVVLSNNSMDQRLHVQQNSLHLCNPMLEKEISVEHRVAGGGFVRDTNKAPVEVIILDDSEDQGVIQVTRSQEELTRAGKKASAENNVTTYTLKHMEKRPCLDEGKTVVIEIQDDEEEFDRQPQVTRKYNGESSHPRGETEVEDNYQTAYVLEPSTKFNGGAPYGQDDLNFRITRITDIMHNQQQKKRKFSSDSTLDLSLRLSCPGTEGNHKVKNEGISAESRGKRKGTVDAALANNSVSALKSRRLMKMGQFLEKPFTSSEIIDVESPSFSPNGRTRAVTIANTSHGKEFVTPSEAVNTNTPLSFSAHANSTLRRKYTKAIDESFRPADKFKFGTTPQVGNMLNSGAPHVGRPLNPFDQVCVTCRNPADFSVPDPDNFYMS